MSPTWALGAAGAPAATATMKKLMLILVAKLEHVFGDDHVIIGIQPTVKVS